MSWHPLPFLAGAAFMLAVLVGPILLRDHLRRRRKRRQSRIAFARRAVARAVLIALGDAGLFEPQSHADGHVDLVLDARDGLLPPTAEDASRFRRRRTSPDPVLSAHRRLALHQKAQAAIDALPRRLLTEALSDLPEGRLLLSLHLPASQTPVMGQEHSIWIGRPDGSDGQRILFRDRFDDDSP